MAWFDYSHSNDSSQLLVDGTYYRNEGESGASNSRGENGGEFDSRGCCPHDVDYRPHGHQLYLDECGSPRRDGTRGRSSQRTRHQPLLASRSPQSVLPSPVFCRAPRSTVPLEGAWRRILVSSGENSSRREIRATVREVLSVVLRYYMARISDHDSDASASCHSFPVLVLPQRSRNPEGPRSRSAGVGYSSSRQVGSIDDSVERNSAA